MSERVNVRDIVGEVAEGETLEVWSDRLMQAGRKAGVYRQCSLGWHDECSQRAHWGPGCECNCTCHVEPREFDFDAFEERNWSPEGVNRVVDYVGMTWTLVPGSKWSRINQSQEVDWLELLRRYGPVTEIANEEADDVDTAVQEA